MYFGGFYLFVEQIINRYIDYQSFIRVSLPKNEPNINISFLLKLGTKEIRSQ